MMRKHRLDINEKKMQKLLNTKHFFKKKKNQETLSVRGDYKGKALADRKRYSGIVLSFGRKQSKRRALRENLGKKNRKKKKEKRGERY